MTRCWLVVLAACGDNALAPVDAASDTRTSVWSCNGTTGLAAPLAPVSPFAPPDCATHVPTMPAFDDNPARAWTDAVTGDARAACVFRPAGTGPFPLVMFFHGATGIGGSAASTIYDATLLRAKAAASRFVLVADQGRVLDNPNSLGGVAIRRDIYYRDLGAPSTNPDFRNADRLIDELVAEGGIDTTRIYAMGWSNGGLFAQEYAIARHAIATPGGHRIAAAVAYAGPDPFENLAFGQSPSCAYAPLPATDLPLDVVHRDCDYPATCDRAQQIAFATPPGFDLEGWVATLRGPMADDAVVDTLLDADGAAASACAPLARCTLDLGAANHGRWPDGISDGSGVDDELAMLAFLYDHPLP